MSSIKPQNNLRQLHELLVSDSFAQIAVLLGTMHMSEIADFLESLPNKPRETIWDMVGFEQKGDILTHLQEAVRNELLGNMLPQEVSATTKAMEADDAADIIQQLPEDLQDSVLLSMDERNRLRLDSVLSYAENSAGGLMNTDVISVRADVPLDAIVRYLKRLENVPKTTDSLMVVDRKNRYLGNLSVIDLLVGDAGQYVAELLQEETAVYCDLSAHEVAKIFEQRDLVSAAVIDAESLLLGRITIDDVVDIIQDEAEQSFRNMVGLSEADMFGPVIKSTKRRSTWLGINMVTAFISAWVIGYFEDSIQQLVALAVLMPVVAGMGGVAGSQTLTIAIRGIAVDQLNRSNAWALLSKEVAVGSLNGILWAGVVAVVVSLWFSNVPLGLIIGLAMVINLVVAAIAGATIPLALKHYGIDPAVAGGVILTTITDVVGFVALLGLASLLLL